MLVIYVQCKFKKTKKITVFANNFSNVLRDFSIYRDHVVVKSCIYKNTVPLSTHTQDIFTSLLENSVNLKLTNKILKFIIAKNCLGS